MTTISEARPHVGVLRVAFAGLAATVVGNGLGRFAYTPLIPALIAAGWFAPNSTVYFAAANLAGYFIGALLARRISILAALSQRCEPRWFSLRSGSRPAGGRLARPGTSGGDFSPVPQVEC